MVLPSPLTSPPVEDQPQSHPLLPSSLSSPPVEDQPPISPPSLLTLRKASVLTFGDTSEQYAPHALGLYMWSTQ